MFARLSWRWQLKNPKISLAISFIAWKVLLLLIACTSPSSGYDTSTTLLMQRQSDSQHVTGTVSRALAEKLTRWDAIYFTNVAHRGAVFEQEWAFGWGYAKLVGILGRSK